MNPPGPPSEEEIERAQRKKHAQRRDDQLPDIREQAEALLAVIETERVVVVDDRAWPVDTYLDALEIAADGDLENLDPEEPDPDEERAVKQKRIRAEWDKQPVDKRSELILQAQEILTEHNPHRALNHLEMLVAMFPEGTVELVEPEQWAQNQSQLLGEGPPPLVLFDHRLENHDKTGLELLAAYLKESSGEVPPPAGILSAEVDQDGRFKAEAEDAATDIPTAELMTMSKVHLQDEDLDRAIGLLRLTANLPKLNQVRRHVLKGLRDAVGAAEQYLDEMPPRVLEDLVYRTSDIEGAWEAETMARVIGLRVIEATRKAQSEDAGLKQIVAEVRKLSSQARQADERSLDEAHELLRIENYAPGTWLSGLQLPLDNGDIFEIAVGGQLRHFVLVAQSCDMVVRPSGEREAGEAALLEIEEHPKPRQTLLYEPLPAVPPEGIPTPSHVRLKTESMINLDILDLCWFTDTGVACVEDVNADSRAEMLTEGLTARRDAILAEARLRLEQLNAAEPGDPLHKMLVKTFSHPLASLQHDPETPGRWCYPLKRVARLERPQAEALLVRYSAAQARAAFDHDLTVLEPPKDRG